MNEGFSYAKTSKEQYYQEVKISDLRKIHIRKFIAHIVYGKSLHHLTNKDDEIINEIISKMENTLDTKFLTEVKNNNIYTLRFGNNKIHSTYKPSIIYFGLKFVKINCYNKFQKLKFIKYKTNNDVTYWTSKIDTNKQTSIFIHGFGLGPFPYMDWIKDMNKYINLIVLVLPNMSNLEYSDKLFPTYSNFKEDFKEIIKKFNLFKVSVIAHSFGTVIAGCYLKDQDICKYIDNLILYEPICFFEGCYKIFKHINQNHKGSWKEKLIKLFIYKDVYVRYVTQRFMFGPEFWILNYKNINNISKNLYLHS